MTTAIVGLGKIGSRVASNLVQGGERVILAGRGLAGGDRMAAELGDLASSATVAHAVDRADAVLLAVMLSSETALIAQISPSLAGKVVIDPSNPVRPDGHGGFARILPAGQSASSVVTELLPPDAHYVKAFSAIKADDVTKAANRQPERAVMFYATDDQTAADTAERLIRAAGFEPLRAGGIEAARRIEMEEGDLHQLGGLNGRLLNLDEASAAVSQVPPDPAADARHARGAHGARRKVRARLWRRA
jgi:hypothetical protein